MTETEFKALSENMLIGEDKTLVDQFNDYWTEKGLTAKKMRFEKEKVFDIKRRFATWKRNASNFRRSFEKPNPIQGTIDAHAEVMRKIENGEI